MTKLQAYLSMPISKNSRLLSEERRRKILQLIERDGQVTITDLASRFSVSGVTVRSDLDALSDTGAVMRSHGRRRLARTRCS